MVHIQKRGPKRWVARWEDPDGRERAKSFQRKVDAEQFLTAVGSDMLRGQYIDPSAGRATFRAVAEAWRASQPHRPSTRVAKDKHLRLHAYPAFGDRQIASIRPSELQAWATGLSATYKLGYVRVIVETVRAVFNSAVTDRLIVTSPAKSIRLPTEHREAVVPLSRDQVEALIVAMTDRYKAAVLLGATAGLRPGELLGVKVADVDFLRRELHVRQQLTEVLGKVLEGPLKTPTSYRKIPLPTFVVEALSPHLAQYPAHPDGWLFTAARGDRVRRTKFMKFH